MRRFIVVLALVVPSAAVAKDAGAPEGARPCASGNSCEDMGRALRDAEASRRDFAKAAVYFEAACRDFDVPSSCASLGALLLGGSVPRDERKAYDAFGKACKAGDIVACRRQAVLLTSEGGQGARPVKRDVRKAVPMLAKACDAGDGASCTILAQMYDEGRGVPKNAKKAGDYRKRADAPPKSSWGN